MLSYWGIDYKIAVKPYLETGKYVSQFSLIHNKGYEIEQHPFTYVLYKGTDDLALFNTEQEAIKAAEIVAKIRIQEILS